MKLYLFKDYMYYMYYNVACKVEYLQNTETNWQYIDYHLV